MKSILKSGLAAIIITSAMLSSCGKYEEGPKISLASKKGRLTRAWTVEKWIDGTTGTEVACTSGCSITEYKKDGTIALNGTTWNGFTWDLSSDKSSIVTSWNGGSTSVKILRLTSKELWVQDITDKDETHYVSN